MNRKAELLQKIGNSGFPGNEVVLTLDEFFIGNNDNGSIGVNLYPDQPSPQTFYEVFKGLLQDGKIEHAFVRIADADDVEWFFSDAIYIIGDITQDELEQAVTSLEPSEIYSGWMYDFPVNLPFNADDRQVYTLWWD